MVKLGHYDSGVPEVKVATSERWLSLVSTQETDSSNLYRDFEEQHRSEIHKFVLRRTGDRDLADEITQDTFVRAWRSLRLLTAHANPRGWLVAVAKNLLVDHYRGTARLVAGAPLEDGVQIEETGGVERLMSDELVSSVLASLSEEHRHVVTLCVLDGRSSAEVAQFLKIPIGTVRSRLHYGLSHLRRSMLTGEIHVEL